MMRQAWGTALLVAACAAGTALMPSAGAQEGPAATTTSSPPTTPSILTTSTTVVEPTTSPTTVATPPTAVEAAPAEAGAPERTEAPEGGRVISGTIKGIDGRFVNAQISLVLRNAAGQFLRLNGTVNPNAAQYADTLSINEDIPLEGSDVGGTDTWRFVVPDTAYDFTFEVYPRSPSVGDRTTGNWSHYGGVSKRRVVIPATGLSDVRLRLPLNCDQPGGTTGSIRVLHANNAVIDDFLALSENNPPSGIQGFRAQGTTRVAANQTFDGIAPDQRYSVNAYVGSGHSLRRFYEVPVRACQTTTLYAYTGASTKPPRWGPVSVSQRGSFFPIAGEFSGDRRDDIFWYAPNAGGDTLAISSGATGQFANEALTVGPGYRPVSGDWNDDGIDDIFWYGPGAARDRIWQGGQGGDFTTVAATAGGNANVWPVAGDFDGNGHSDILFAEGGRLSTVRRYTDNGYTNGSAQVPANSAVRSGDVNGDFRDDLLWYNSGTGQVQLWFGRADGSFAKVNEQVGARQNYRPVLADISGDFRADLLWYGPGSTKDSLWRGRANTLPYFAKESADLRVGGNYQPFALDLNGEGTQDIYWYAPGTTADSAWKMNLSGWIPQA
ncbi:MAG: VCBS repeat-containing protein [Acidimicrobiales bacterium]|nr:VCBS repeat-containing protein [Acidimicrobiales bacterium]